MALAVRDFTSDEVLAAMSDAALVQLQRLNPSALGLRECARRTHRLGRAAFIARAMDDLVRPGDRLGRMLDDALAIVDGEQAGVASVLRGWRERARG
jgi:hypothetical protein